MRILSPMRMRGVLVFMGGVAWCNSDNEDKTDAVNLIEPIIL